MALLDFLSTYANLILAAANIVLVGVTAAYVYLTSRMLREMREAREHQSDATIIVAPVPSRPVYARLQLHNAGPGPASDVQLSFHLEPPLDTPTRTWHHPLILAQRTHLFLLPEPPNSGGVTDIRTIADKHKSLEVSVQWTNVFGRRRDLHCSFDLPSLPEGWYHAGHLIPPDDVETQLKELAETLSKIERHVESAARSR